MKLSIITVNLNNAAGLKRTIESVITQTFTDYEYIIIDGGSTDGSVDIIKQYSDKITYWVSESDKGIYNAMNKGVQKANGEYFIFMNSGDCFFSDILSKVHEQLNADIVCGNREMSLKDGEKDFHISPRKNDLSMWHFYIANPFPHQACFIKGTLFQADSYNEENRIASDWEFFLKQTIINNCSYEHIDAVIAIMEPYGISHGFTPLHLEERRESLEKMLPYRIRKDYEVLSLYKTSRLCSYIVTQKRAIRLERLITKIAKVLYFFHGLFKK